SVAIAATGPAVPQGSTRKIVTPILDPINELDREITGYVTPVPADLRTVTVQVRRSTLDSKDPKQISKGRKEGCSSFTLNPPLPVHQDSNFRIHPVHGRFKVQLLRPLGPCDKVSAKAEGVSGVSGQVQAFAKPLTRPDIPVLDAKKLVEGSNSVSGTTSKGADVEISVNGQ
ncbi:MAG: hypothetical protein V3T83_21640, partial [Acidobacteriota bacterium]